MSTDFNFVRLVELCQRTYEETRHSAARAIDRSLVVRNWLFGWYIVEYEQHGAERAEYGRQLLVRIAGQILPKPAKQMYKDGFKFPPGTTTPSRTRTQREDVSPAYRDNQTINRSFISSPLSLHHSQLLCTARTVCSGVLGMCGRISTPVSRCVEIRASAERRAGL